MSYRKQSEEALRDYLQSKVGVPVYAATRDEIKGLPCVVVAYEGGTENPPNTGNMDVQLNIMLQSEIDGEAQPGALDIHDTTLSQIEDALFYSGLNDLNNYSADFHFFGVTEHQGSTRDMEDGVLTETITVTLASAAGNFS